MQTSCESGLAEDLHSYVQNIVDSCLFFPNLPRTQSPSAPRVVIPLPDEDRPEIGEICEPLDPPGHTLLLFCLLFDGSPHVSDIEHASGPE